MQIHDCAHLRGELHKVTHINLFANSAARVAHEHKISPPGRQARADLSKHRRCYVEHEILLRHFRERNNEFAASQLLRHSFEETSAGEDIYKSGTSLERGNIRGKS